MSEEKNEEENKEKKKKTFNFKEVSKFFKREHDEIMKEKPEIIKLTNKNSDSNLFNGILKTYFIENKD